jgi:hypothetical protein
MNFFLVCIHWYFFVNCSSVGYADWTLKLLGLSSQLRLNVKQTITYIQIHTRTKEKKTRKERERIEREREERGG